MIVIYSKPKFQKNFLTPKIFQLFKQPDGSNVFVTFDREFNSEYFIILKKIGYHGRKIVICDIVLIIETIEIEENSIF